MPSSVRLSTIMTGISNLFSPMSNGRVADPCTVTGSQSLPPTDASWVSIAANHCDTCSTRQKTIKIQQHLYQGEMNKRDHTSRLEHDMQ